MSSATSGYLLIADITGYTAYLSSTELDHAQEILKTLLELLVDHTLPPMVISRLAGDAVISYSLQGQGLQGQTFIEMIENTYVAFRKAIERMVLNNTCHCKACANISSLDLKFFVHYGEFVRQRLDQHDELVGSDVIVIHRLLKNHVVEQTGFRAYTLYTDAAIRAMGLEAMSAYLTPHGETYEHLGDVKTWVQDMQPVWEQKRDMARVTIPTDKMLMQWETEIALPQHVVWDYLTDPVFRINLGADSVTPENLQRGRMGEGSRYQCYHGKQQLIQTILEWQPFEHEISEDLIAPNTYVMMDFRLSPTERGTRFVVTYSKARGPLVNRMMFNTMMKFQRQAEQKHIEHFKMVIEADYAKRGSPASPGRAALDATALSAAARESLQPAVSP